MTSLRAAFDPATTVLEEPISPPAVAPVDTPQTRLAAKKRDKLIMLMRQATKSLSTEDLITGDRHAK